MKIDFMKVYFQAKVDDILEIVTKMHYGKHFERILAQYADMMKHKAEGNLGSWALHFQYNLSYFKETLIGFGKENVTGYLKEVFKQNCATSLIPLFETYKYDFSFNYHKYDVIQLTFLPFCNFVLNKRLIYISF